MGGFFATFVRIPDGEDAGAFATGIARLLHDSPAITNKNTVYVQFVEGFSWLHIEELEFPSKFLEGDHPAFASAGLETVWIACHSGSSSYNYFHYQSNHCLRSIMIDDVIHSNFGTEEEWEQAERDALAAQLARWGDEPMAWPRGFNTDMILKALALPSPWSGGDLETLDICICVSNPDENDMSFALE